MKTITRPTVNYGINNARLCRAVVLGLALSTVVALFAAETSLQAEQFRANTSMDTYYISDHLATTVASIDAAGLIAQLETDAFGAPLGTGTNDARYTGKPFDSDMGAYVFPYRNYRADEARWMTLDPRGFPNGKNNSKYIDNPVFAIDRLGLTASTSSVYNKYINATFENAVSDNVGSGAGAAATLTYSASSDSNTLAYVDFHTSDPNTNYTMFSDVYYTLPLNSGFFLQEVWVNMEYIDQGTTTSVSNESHWIEGVIYDYTLDTITGVNTSAQSFGSPLVLTNDIMHVDGHRVLIDRFNIDLSDYYNYGVPGSLTHTSMVGWSQFIPFSTDPSSMFVNAVYYPWANNEPGAGFMFSNSLIYGTSSNTSTPTWWSGRNASYDVIHTMTIE